MISHVCCSVLCQEYTWSRESLNTQGQQSTTVKQQTRGRYYGGRRQSSNNSFHSPTVIPPSALDKPSIMKRYHRRRTCSHTLPSRSPTMVTLHDTRFVECRWWNDGWTEKTDRHLTVVGLHGTSPRKDPPLVPAPGT